MKTKILADFQMSIIVPLKFSVSNLVSGENLRMKILEIWQKQKQKNETCVTKIFVKFASAGKNELPKFR